MTNLNNILTTAAYEGAYGYEGKHSEVGKLCS